MNVPEYQQVSIRKIKGASFADCNDLLATEEPLEIRLLYPSQGVEIEKSISITMRTPGNDVELAKGFLYTEGMIRSLDEVISARYHGNNIVRVIVNALTSDISKLDRNFYTTSSCGVCGKSSIESIRTVSPFPLSKDKLEIRSTVFYSLPGKLKNSQVIFETTGGLHAAALFDIAGNLLLLREDVGRHNALDKLIGASLESLLLPFDNHILLLSGRASFELIQKAWMAGIKIVAAVGAPSTLAVELALEAEMTLIGFLRGECFNVYTGIQRIGV